VRPHGHGRGASGFGRAIYNAILEEIAARLQRIGVVGGTAIDAAHLVGVPPPGVSRLTVQHDGVDVGTVPTLNFAGPSWVVVYEASADRVNVSLASGGTAPDPVFARATGEVVVGRTGGEDVYTRLA
jgi:hypothetical protein